MMLVPLKLYFTEKGRGKVELGLGTRQEGQSITFVLTQPVQQPICRASSRDLARLLLAANRQKRTWSVLRKHGTEVATFTLSAVTAVRAHAPKSVSFARQVDQILAAFDTWIGGKPQQKNRH
jgi:hypothetical protein